MAAAGASPGPADRHGAVVPIVLVLLATIAGVLSVFALWGKRQLLETETWSTTSGELIENAEIQEAVSGFIVASIFEGVDVEQALAERLPDELVPLAGPASAGLRNVAGDVALRALDQPRVQQLWVQANEGAHARLVTLIEDRGTYLSTAGGVVTLDLKQLLEAVTVQLGIGSKLVAKLPADAASLEVMRSDQLGTAQRVVNALQRVGYLLTALTLLLYAAAVGIASGRRRRTLRDAGIGFVAIGVIALLARTFAREPVVSALSQAPATDAPVGAAFDIGTSLLRETAQSIIAYGVVIVAAAWLAGPSAWATGLRRAVAPYLRQPRFAYGGLAVVLVLLFWWDPLVATHRFVPSIILVLLLAIGTEALRRQVAGEFPDAHTARSPAGIARRLAERMSQSRERRVERGRRGGEADDRVDQLERLWRLREEHVLSDEEFAREKERLLAR